MSKPHIKEVNICLQKMRGVKSFIICFQNIGVFSCPSQLDHGLWNLVIIPLSDEYKLKMQVGIKNQNLNTIWKIEKHCFLLLLQMSILHITDTKFSVGSKGGHFPFIAMHPDPVTCQPIRFCHLYPSNQWDCCNNWQWLEAVEMEFTDLDNVKVLHK